MKTSFTTIFALVIVACSLLLLEVSAMGPSNNCIAIENSRRRALKEFQEKNVQLASRRKWNKDVTNGMDGSAVIVTEKDSRGGRRSSTTTSSKTVSVEQPPPTGWAKIISDVIPALDAL